jgi:hypothetical protein
MGIIFPTYGKKISLVWEKEFPPGGKTALLEKINLPTGKLVFPNWKPEIVHFTN